MPNFKSVVHFLQKKIAKIGPLSQKLGQTQTNLSFKQKLKVLLDLSSVIEYISLSWNLG